MAGVRLRLRVKVTEDRSGEARNWYYKARHVLIDSIVAQCIDLLSRISRLLPTIINNQRILKVEEETINYE